MVNLDFETRSPVPISNGLARYAAQAQVLCLAYDLGAGVRSWTPDAQPPTDLIDAVVAGDTVAGWNVMFEWVIWNQCLVPLGWPALRLEQCRDTMAQAAVMNLPQGLGNCASALGLSEQKDKRGAQLIKALCIPQKDGTWLEDAGLLSELVEYCKQDVRTEQAIGARLVPLSEAEQAVWVATQRVNQAGLPVAVEEAKRIAWIVEQEQARLNDVVKQVTKYAVTSGTQRDVLLTWVRSQGVQADSLTAGSVAVLLADIAVTGDVRTVLECRQKVSQTSTAKIDKILDIHDGGRIRGLLAYHGASTGRFASRGGFNAQNLPRPSVKDVDSAHTVLGCGDHQLAYAVFGEQVMDYAVASIRGLICAPKGYEFIDADFSSVENRVGVWVADQTDKVALFGAGLDEYRTFASEVLFKVPYDKVTGEMRQISKAAILGCLFGQGANGLKEYAAIFGVDLTLEKSKEIVTAYRASYANVAKCWKACMNAAVRALNTPSAAVPVNDKLTFRYADSFLRLRLPSGRVLYWYKPQITEGKYGEVIKYEAPEGERTLIGSSLYQNAVQAIARDLLCNAMLNLQGAGYEVVMLVHDEVLAVVKEGEGDEAEFRELMCKAPAWAAGLPLAAESWRDRRFRK